MTISHLVTPNDDQTTRVAVKKIRKMYKQENQIRVFSAQESNLITFISDPENGKLCSLSVGFWQSSSKRSFRSGMTVEEAHAERCEMMMTTTTMKQE